MSNSGSALTLMAVVDPAQRDALVRYLDDEGGHVGDPGRDFTLRKLRQVHFLRWVVIDLPLREGETQQRSILAFESNYDGSLDDHLAELVTHCAPGIRRAYAHCEGAKPPSSDAELPAFLKALEVPYAAFHVAHHGRSVARILAEDAVRNALEAYLDAHPERLAAPSRKVLFHELVAAVPPPLLAMLRETQVPVPPSTPRSVYLAALGGLALAVAPVSLPILAAFAVWNLIREPLDEAAKKRAPRPPPSVDEVARLLAREDFKSQNQLTHVVALKPGPVRRATVGLVLRGIEFLARRTYTRTYLGSMSMIHFARWAFIDDPRLIGEGAAPTLVFFSNYDGSWESYLGDFVDKAAEGLTGIWSNSVGFPQAFLLLWRGARKEDEFKTWVRRCQQRTQLWYAAYHHLSVANIRRNAQICDGLVELAEAPAGAPLRSARIDAWLRLL